ncbi:MAG: metal-dependent phosphohydrolase [Pseudanabaenaceae cyanobacterium bins.68]|nr:metal-dependent phosphohydrolase [Pseudanabaenaceae cyanobacterium bins.68]
MPMFNATQIILTHFIEQLKQGYERTYGGMQSHNAEIIAWAANMSLETIANSNALYHNIEHTVLVTLVGQEILRGKHLRAGGITPQDWLHCLISLLCHDIGYVRGICRQDQGNQCATGVAQQIVQLPPGASDASLTPYHVDRAKLFIRERFSQNQHIQVEIVCQNIELTRFPVPKTGDHADTENFPGLIRAADLIGQLSDPNYLRKINALYHEFVETGVAQALGYDHAGDLRRDYAKFFWTQVHPYIQPALTYLSLTQEGKEYVAHLYANVFMVEHESLSL